MIKRFYYDLETTGVDYQKNAIHQIAIIIELDGKIIEKIDWRMRPFDNAVVEDKALEVGGVTLEQINKYEDPKKIHRKLLSLLNKYVDRYDKYDKFHLVGFNNRYFDDRFLRSWFERSDDPYFGSWFWADSLDVMVLASQYLLEERPNMLNFKLATVADYLGVIVDSDKLHDGLYDVELTREVYHLIDLM